MLYAGKLYKAFCLQGFKDAFVHVIKNPQEMYLTLNMTGFYNKPTMSLLVFKPLDHDFYNTFYLEYYGWQTAYQRIDHYCLSRDNPNGSQALIPMSAITNDLLLKLSKVPHKHLCSIESLEQSLPQKIKMGSQTYSLLKLTSSFDASLLLSCDYIINSKGSGYVGLCHTNTTSRFIYKEGYLTLELSHTFSKDMEYKRFIMIKERGDHLYLHQYSEQVFKKKGGIKELVRSHVFYSQSRDDPSGKNPLNTDDYFNTSALESLATLCYKHRLCIRE